jgi:outer membrane protein TolC
MKAGVAWMLLAGCGLRLAAQVPGEALRLGHREALATALRNNLQVPIAREVEAEARSRALQEEGAFDPELEVKAQGDRTVSFLDQAQPSGPVLEQRNATDSLGITGKVSQNLPWGASWEFSCAPSYTSSSSRIAGALDPSGLPMPPYRTTTPFPYSGQFTAKYAHHLLRGAGRTAATSRREAARKDAEAADPAYRLAVTNLVAAVENQYWDLAFAEKHLASKRTALDLARKLLQENTIRVQVGTMAPIEVISAESQVAQAEQDIIACEVEVQNARAALLRSIYPGAGAPAALELADDLVQEHTRLEEADALRMALDRRMELRAARLGLEATRIRARATADLLRPRLDASVSLTGTAGDHDHPGAVQGDLAGLRNPGCGCALTFAVPLFNRTAKGRHAQARAVLRKEELKLRDLELEVALEVGRALRSAEAARKGVEAAAKTRRFQEQNLEAERRKLEHGLSTSFTVLQVMTSLDKSRSEELRSRLAYAKAVTVMQTAVGNLLEARDLVLN